MKWCKGEIATLQWDMKDKNIPKWVSVMPVLIEAIDDGVVQVKAAPYHTSMNADLFSLFTSTNAFDEVSWFFDANTGYQIPGTKFKYRARLIKLIDQSNN